MKNTQKKEIFSLGLYKEALRRVKLPGIIFFVILGLEALLVPIGCAIDTYSYLDLGEVPNVSTISALDVHPFVVASIFIIAPVITWTLFSFLNKRNSSDYYHSLPHTRISLYLSTVAAIVTWIVGIVVSTSLLSILGHLIFPDLYTVLYTSYLTVGIGCTVASLLVSAIITLAMCITGTVLNNVVVTGLIMFMPRMVITLVTSAVNDNLPIAMEGSLSLLMSAKVNILTGWMEGIVSSSSTYYATGLTGYASQIYTVVLALVYFTIASVMFVRRHSEAAERSAPSRKMQAFFRILITMAVCAPLCFVIYVNNYVDSVDIFLYAVWYLVAVLVYFVYEIVTTRKWKNLLRALPGLGIVALLNVIMLTSIHGFYVAELNYTPDADDVEYIRILPEYSYILSDYYYGQYDYSEYASALTKDIKITDKDAIKAVTDAISENVEAIKLGVFDNRYNKYFSYSHVYDYSVYPESSDEDTYTSCCVAIKSGLTTKYRQIRLKSSDYESLSAALENSDGYKKAWMDLPDATDGTVELNSNYYGYLNITNDQGRELAKSLKYEVLKLDFEEWYGFVNYIGDYSYGQEVGEVIYSTVLEGKSVSLRFRLDPRVLPKTTQLYFDIVSEVCPISAETLYKSLTEDLSDEEDRQLEIYYGALVTYDAEGGYYSISSLQDTSSDEFKAALATMAYNGSPKVGDHYLILNAAYTKMYYDAIDGVYSQVYESASDGLIIIAMSEEDCQLFFE